MSVTISEQMVGNNKGILVVGTGEDPSILMEYAKSHALGMPDIHIVGNTNTGFSKIDGCVTGSISELISFKCKEVMQQLTLTKEDLLIDEPFYNITRRERRANERKNNKKKSR
jgi:hypothetical protein